MLKTRTECLEEYGSDYFINRMVDEGKLFRVDKGIFSERWKGRDLGFLFGEFAEGAPVLIVKVPVAAFRLTCRSHQDFFLCPQTHSRKIFFLFPIPPVISLFT